MGFYRESQKYGIKGDEYIRENHGEFYEFFIG